MRRIYIIKTTKTEKNGHSATPATAPVPGFEKDFKNSLKIKSEPGKPASASKTCMVKGCYANCVETEVFAVPFTESMREKWLENIKFRKRPGRAPKHTYVCKRHFEPQCLMPNKDHRCRARLRRGAVPTLNLDLLGLSGGDDSFVVHPCGVDSDDEDGPPKLLKRASKREAPMLREIQDHNYSSNVARSPETLASDLKKAKRNIEELQKEVHCLRGGLFRWKKAAKRLNNLDVKMKRLFPLEDLEKESTKKRLELVSALAFREKKRKFPQKVKEMAMNIFFHSPSCYMYLRGQFHLPSVTLLRQWLNQHKKEPERDDVKEEVFSDYEIE